MNIFKCKQFSILQEINVFKVGTDAFLLGSLATVNYKLALEVGAGTGIISLMLAQRNLNVKIEAIDIDKKAVRLTKVNFKNAPFSERLKIYHTSLQKFLPQKKYDSIISNPPYFIPTLYKHKTLSNARTQNLLPINELFNFAHKHLKENGSLQIIFPFSELEKLNTLAIKNNFKPKRIVKIRGNFTVDFKRVMIEYTLTPKNLLPIITEFIIEKERGVFTEAYKKLTSDFHI